MSDPLYDVADIETAIRDAARTTIPEAVTNYAGQLPVKAGDAVPYLLWTVRAPVARGPMMAGDQTLDLTVSWTATGKDHVQAARVAAAARAFLLGRDGDGAFSTPIPIDGDRAVLDRQPNSDGAPDNVGGLQQWTETAQLLIGRA